MGEGNVCIVQTMFRALDIVDNSPLLTYLKQQEIMKFNAIQISFQTLKVTQIYKLILTCLRNDCLLQGDFVYINDDLNNIRSTNCQCLLLKPRKDQPNERHSVSQQTIGVSAPTNANKRSLASANYPSRTNEWMRWCSLGLSVDSFI